MGRLLNATVSATLLLGLAVAGCGGSSSTSSSTQAGNTSHAASQQQTGTGASTSAGTGATGAGTKEHFPTVSIELSSTAFNKSGGPIPARYTCDGGGVSPPLQWKAPSGIAELVLFITAFNPNAPGDKEPISWAVAGLQPTLKGLAAGTLPASAVVGRNSFGQTRYTVCPRKGSGTQHYLVVLLALKQPVAAKPGFAAQALYQTVASTATYKGLAGFTYKRG